MENVSTFIIGTAKKMVHVGVSSVIGKRQYQQDAVKTDTFNTYLENGKLISVLCDGMGGMNGGEKASKTCSETVFSAFHKIDTSKFTIPEFYKEVVQLADRNVRSIKNEDGTPLVGSGTTLASVVIDGEFLYWTAVGDSRIYLIRNNQIMQITCDQNYLMILMDKVKKGEITREQALADPKREALINYIGSGAVRDMCRSLQPYKLENKDKIIICSDGLYRSLSNVEMANIVLKHDREAQLAAEELTATALAKNLKNQDNTTVIVLNFKN